MTEDSGYSRSVQKYRAAIKALNEAAVEVEKLHTLPAEACLILYTIAKNPGCTCSEIAQIIGLPRSRVSKHCEVFSDPRTVKGRLILYVRKERIMRESERFRLFLTQKGEEKYNEICRNG